MGFFKSAGDLVLSGSLSSEDRDDAELWVWPDADLAGDELSTRSTCGFFLEVVGREDRSSPISWGACKTPATATSTPEAETVSMASVLGCNKFVQGEALPAQRLLELVLGRPVRLVVQEDNESSIAIVRKGWSPKLRTLLRNQKCNLQQLHELITADEEQLEDRGPVVLRHHEGETFWSLASFKGGSSYSK